MTSITSKSKWRKQHNLHIVLVSHNTLLSIRPQDGDCIKGFSEISFTKAEFELASLRSVTEKLRSATYMSVLPSDANRITQNRQCNWISISQLGAYLIFRSWWGWKRESLPVKPLNIVKFHDPVIVLSPPPLSLPFVKNLSTSQRK